MLLAPKVPPFSHFLLVIPSHFQADITHLDQEVTYSNGSSKPASSKVKRDPSAPRFEVTDTVYAAPFYLTSMGECIGPAHSLQLPADVASAIRTVWFTDHRASGKLPYLACCRRQWGLVCASLVARWLHFRCAAGITVHALGEVYRGPFSSNYWSSKGSLYRHIYPVRGLLLAARHTAAGSIIIRISIGMHFWPESPLHQLFSCAAPAHQSVRTCPEQAATSTTGICSRRRSGFQQSAMLESLRAKAVVEGAFCTWFTAQVGYHASKEAFGRIWDMRITAGDGGPVFTVSMQHKLASCHQRGCCLLLLGRCCDTPACVAGP
jgi:hypothetical protein